VTRRNNVGAHREEKISVELAKEDYNINILNTVICFVACPVSQIASRRTFKNDVTVGLRQTLAVYFGLRNEGARSADLLVQIMLTPNPSCPAKEDNFT
jgi:hypothetical protein